MSYMNSICKLCIINKRFFKTLSSLNTSFNASSTEQVAFNIKNEYLRYKFLRHDDTDDDLGNVKWQKFERSFTVIPDAVTEVEELRLVDEIEKLLKRLRYQHDHWDDAIHGYRETEISSWKDPQNTIVMQNLRNKIFSDESKTQPMQRVHVLDLCNTGYVKPHIDSVRFCGNIIAGLSLLSDSIMRLADEHHPDTYAIDAFLPRRSLYIMKDNARYHYTHEILSDGASSMFDDKQIVRQRRVSIVMRNEPLIDTTA